MILQDSIEVYMILQNSMGFYWIPQDSITKVKDSTEIYRTLGFYNESMGLYRDLQDDRIL